MVRRLAGGLLHGGDDVRGIALLLWLLVTGWVEEWRTTNEPEVSDG